MNRSRTPREQLFFVSASFCEFQTGIFGAIAASLLLYAVKSSQTYPANVLFIMSCSLVSTILMTSLLVWSGIYGIGDFFQPDLIVIKPILCYITLVALHFCSFIILPFYFLLICERLLFEARHSLQEHQKATLVVKVWILYILKHGCSFIV